MRSAICLGLFLALVTGGWAAPARACKCAQRPIAASYATADDVLKVRLLQQLPAPRGLRRYLAVTLFDAFKGCIKPRSLVVIETSSESAACGAMFELGSQQLLFTTRLGTRFGLPVVSTGTCSGNRAWSAVSEEDWAFLSTRIVRCGDKTSCVDSEMAQCFVDPCEVSECSEPDAVCSANYCGGCHAEWYSSAGDPVLSCWNAARVCDDPRRSYVSHDPEECTRIDYICKPGTRQFTDSCGCGCFTPDAPAPKPPCRQGGCAGQLCLGPDDPTPITTCVFLPEYACLPLTTCEPQADGVCGFTQSPEYTACVEAARKAP